MSQKLQIKNFNNKKIMKKNYSEKLVVSSILKTKKSVKIDTVKKVIFVPTDNIEVGNGTWGKIDYLQNCHGYVVVRKN